MNTIKIISNEPNAKALLSGMITAIEHFCDSDDTDVVDKGDNWIVVRCKDLDTSVYLWELDSHGLNPIQ
ncbi:MAG: hypothetical protein ABFD96_19285 [Armatimonadia bacterium]